jgi:formylmethanofuran dehydrogenase subunit B
MADLGRVTCAGCALLCDDVTVEASNDGVRLQPRCPLGAQWFSERRHRLNGPPATINGEPADLESALARAAELLRDARRALLYGFERATVEDARAAVALADRLGALVSTGPNGGSWPGAPAISLRGASTATLGEIRDRSRLVVIWREDPETTHPRLLDRLGFDGDAERILVVVDEVDTATSGRTRLRLSWPRELDLEALTLLHAMQRGLAVRPGELDLPLSGLLKRMRAVPHLAFVYGAGLTAGAGGQRRALALHELVRALCQERHAVTLELPDAPGIRSADDVLAWQSGYGGTVDFAGGHPELALATQPLLDDVDVTLCVESAPERQTAGVAQIVLSGVPGPDVEVSIRTAAAGIEASGTVHRLDGVPLTLQAPHPGDAPTAAALLTRLLAQVGR